MDILWIVLAFAFGLAMRQVGLPPLVGYLLAGFLLSSQGVVGGETVQRFADLGVTLLLFTIGLKLHLKDLAAPVVWLSASVHMLLTSLLVAVLVLLAVNDRSRMGPAHINGAVANALGIRITDAPLTPKKILDVLHAQGKEA